MSYARCYRAMYTHLWLFCFIVLKFQNKNKIFITLAYSLSDVTIERCPSPRLCAHTSKLQGWRVVGNVWEIQDLNPYLPYEKQTSFYCFLSNILCKSCFSWYCTNVHLPSQTSRFYSRLVYLFFSYRFLAPVGPKGTLQGRKDKAGKDEHFTLVDSNPQVTLFSKTKKNLFQKNKVCKNYYVEISKIKN